MSLVIKTTPPNGLNPDWYWLCSRSYEDSRIHLISESLPRDELLALYGCCDVFLSLHRSEGFGRSLAESLQLGLDVIATDFGGNTDFCTGALAHPVKYNKVPIPRNSYPYADGHFWAEPDLIHAASLCQEVALKRITTNSYLNSSEVLLAIYQYREYFSSSRVGLKYADRLQSIWAERHAIKDNLRWAT